MRKWDFQRQEAIKKENKQKIKWIYQSILSNKSAIQTFLTAPNRTHIDIHNRIKQVLIQNYYLYQEIKQLEKDISYKEIKVTYKPIVRLVNKDEYDNMAETRKREDFVNTSFNNYLSSFDR